MIDWACRSFARATLVLFGLLLVLTGGMALGLWLRGWL